MREPPQARTPPDTVSLRLKKPKSKAAGLPAVTSSLVHGLTKMGPVKTVKTLRLVNQKTDLIALVVLGPTLNIERVLNFVKTGPKPLLMKP